MESKADIHTSCYILQVEDLDVDMAGQLRLAYNFVRWPRLRAHTKTTKMDKQHYR